MLELITTGWTWSKKTLASGVNLLKENRDTKRQNADLLDENLQVREDLRKANTRIVELEAEVAELRTRLAKGPELEFRAPFFWAVDESAPNPGPFCPKCHAESGKAVPMYSHNGGICCTGCEKWYTDPEAPPVQPKAPVRRESGFVSEFLRRDPRTGY